MVLSIAVVICVCFLKLQFGENDVEQKNMQAGAGRDASAACDAEFFAISDHEIVCKESEALQSTVSEYYEVIGEVSTHWAALKQAISLCNPDASTASVLDQDVDENADMCIECAVSAEEFQGLIIGATASAIPCHSLMETCKVLEQSAISFEQKWIDVLADDIHASSYSKTKYDLTRQQEVEIFTEAFCKQLKAFACVSRQLPVKKQYRDDIDYRYALCTHCLTTSKLLKCIPSLGNSSSKTFKEVCVLNNIKDLYVKLPTVGAYTKVNHLSDVGVSDSVEVTTVRKQLDNECKALHESIVKHIKLPRVHHNDSTVIPQFLSQFLSICWRIEAAEMLQKKQYNHSKNQAQAHAVTYDACVNLLEKGESLLVSMKYVHDGSGQSQPPASIINPSFEFQGLMEAIEGAQVVVDMIDQSKDIFEDAILSSTAIFEEYVDSFSRSRSASEVSESNEFSSFPHLKRPIESGSSRDMQTKRKNSFDPRQQSSNLLNATVGSSRLEKILKCYDASETNPLGLGAEGYSVLAEAMNSWNSSQQFVELFSDLLSDMNALPISVGNESKAFVDEAFHVCDSMRKAFDVLHTMKEKFVDSDQNTSNTAAAISATPLSFKNILHLQSTMKKLLSDMTNARSKSFTLLNVLYKCLSNVVQEAQRWETLVSSLVPQRATRTKTKMELKSVKKHQLQEALSMPIATVIAINPTLVNNITISLQTADIVADEIKCLLQGVGDRTSIELSKNTRTVGDDGKTINVSGDLRGFYISQWDTILKDYSYVEEILERADLLTFELPEMGAIVWCSNVLKWLHALHNLLRLSSTGNAPGSTNIEFKSALPKYKEASKLFMNLEPGVLDLLIKWEIISTVSCEDTGKNSRIVVPSTSKALPSLMLASCVYETFTIKLNEIQEQEKEIQSILSDMEVLSTSAAFKENHEKLTALHGEMTNNSCITGCSRGTLDAMRRRLGLSVSSEVSHSHSSTPKRKAVDMDREEDWVGDGFLSHEEYDDAMDMYDDEFTVRKEKSKKVPVPKKRPRIQEHSVPSLQIKTSDVEFKKKSGIRYKCLRKDCSNECPDVSVSVYCCADCSVSNAQEHYDALMKYRQLIYRIVHDVKDRNSSSNVGLVSHLDINAMDPTVGGVPHIDIATSVQRMYGGVKKMGYDCGILQKILDRNHHAAIADAQVKQEDIGAVPPAELHGLLQLVHEEEGDKVVCKPSLVDTMRLSLPDAVHLVLKVSNQAATPRTPGTPGGSPKAAIATVDNIRATVRQNFEDSVYVSLCGTLQEFGLSSKSAVLAVDIEEDLYARYNPGGQFNKKEYRTHFLMLVRNLKHVHNRPLVSL